MLSKQESQHHGLIFSQTKWDGLPWLHRIMLYAWKYKSNQLYMLSLKNVGYRGIIGGRFTIWKRFSATGANRNYNIYS